jgi:hypothetical protein
LLSQKFWGYPLGFDGFCDVCNGFRIVYPVVLLFFVVVILHTTNRGAGASFFWLFVTKMRGQRDDVVRLRQLFVGKRCRRGVRRSPRSCKMILLILPCPI